MSMVLQIKRLYGEKRYSLLCMHVVTFSTRLRSEQLTISKWPRNQNEWDYYLLLLDTEESFCGGSLGYWSYLTS